MFPHQHRHLPCRNGCKLIFCQIGLTYDSFQNHFFNFMDDDELEKLFNDVITSIVPESLGIIWEEMKEIFDKPLEDVSLSSLCGDTC
jgi:hypothetical protein